MDFQGLEVIQEQLKEKGWTIYPNYLKHEYDECNWIACKRVPDSEHVRECECNDRKVQWVITPYCFTITSNYHESLTVAITGEYEAHWYELNSYSLDTKELGALDRITMSLLKAWNALGD